MKYVIILLFLFSCSKSEVIPELDLFKLSGTFKNDKIVLTFQDNKIQGNTECNTIGGDYFTDGNNIFINIGGTKVFCENEFEIRYIRESKEFKINDNQLILIGSDYQLIFDKE